MKDENLKMQNDFDNNSTNQANPQNHQQPYNPNPYQTPYGNIPNAPQKKKLGTAAKMGIILGAIAVVAIVVLLVGYFGAIAEINRYKEMYEEDSGINTDKDMDSAVDNGGYQKSREIVASDGGKYIFILTYNEDFSAITYKLLDSNNLVVYKFESSVDRILGGDYDLDHLTDENIETLKNTIDPNRFDIMLYDIPTTYSGMKYLAVEFSYPWGLGGAEGRVYQIVGIKSDSAVDIVNIGSSIYRDDGTYSVRTENIIGSNSVRFFIKYYDAREAFGNMIDANGINAFRNDKDDYDFYYLKLTLTGNLNGNTFTIEETPPPYTDIVFSGQK